MAGNILLPAGIHPCQLFQKLIYVVGKGPSEEQWTPMLRNSPWILTPSFLVFRYHPRQTYLPSLSPFFSIDPNSLHPRTCSPKRLRHLISALNAIRCLQKDRPMYSRGALSVLNGVMVYSQICWRNSRGRDSNRSRRFIPDPVWGSSVIMVWVDSFRGHRISDSSDSSAIFSNSSFMFEVFRCSK